MAGKVYSQEGLAGALRITWNSLPGGLSEREVQVLRLIAAGKTNRDIAEELIISPRTVANHVTNILNKTNAANRTEALPMPRNTNWSESRQPRHLAWTSNGASTGLVTLCRRQ